jgi:hypothetical protein
MPAPSSPSRPTPARITRLIVDIEQEAMDLLRQECILSPGGKYLGLSRAVSKCIFAYLGGKKIYEKSEP